jgi:hypothetical protein
VSGRAGALKAADLGDDDRNAKSEKGDTNQHFVSLFHQRACAPQNTALNCTRFSQKAGVSPPSQLRLKEIKPDDYPKHRACQLQQLVLRRRRGAGTVRPEADDNAI